MAMSAVNASQSSFFPPKQVQMGMYWNISGPLPQAIFTLTPSGNGDSH